MLEQIAFNTRPTIEEHMLVVMKKPIQEENLTQPLITNKQFKIAVTFLTTYNGSFNATSKNNKVYFTTSVNDDDFSGITISQGAYEIESLQNEIKRIIIEEGYFQEGNYPFSNKANFPTSRSIREKHPGVGVQMSFIQEDSIRYLLGVKSVLVYKKYNISDNPVDILSFHNTLLECDIAQGIIFQGRRSGIIHNFTMDLNPGYKYREKFRGNTQWHMMESKDFISNISFELKNENGEASINQRSINNIQIITPRSLILLG